MKPKKIAAFLCSITMLFVIFTATTEAQTTPAGRTETPAVYTPNKKNGAIKGAVIEAATAINPTTSVDDGPVGGILPARVHDPLEKFNRSVFAFNETVDRFILKPIATLYNTVMPKPLNQGVHNVFSNLGLLPTIANDILQFNFYQMANDLWRLGINTTIGVGGLFDVASRMGLKYYANDFGLTLAKYGWKNSTYVVLPLFGPSTIRDIVEIPVDYNLFSVYPYIDSQSVRYGLYGVGVVDRRAQLLQFQNVFEEAAIDRYVFVRNAYMQRRAFQMKENQGLGFRNQQVAKAATTETGENT